jgi:hypothetical protein
MSSLITMALYQPKDGKNYKLKEILQNHVPTLRQEDLITDQELITIQAEDGTIIEIFEWKSVESKDKAHQLPNVMGIWKEIMEVADIKRFADLTESQMPFPNFKRI